MSQLNFTDRNSINNLKCEKKSEKLIETLNIEVNRMDRVISVSFGEIALKGKNRGYFESQLIGKIKRAINEFDDISIYKDQGKIYINCNEEDVEGIIAKVRNVFGIIYISPCYRVEKDLEEAKKAAAYILEEKKRELGKDEVTFKVEAKRADKNFPMKSPEIARNVGGYLLKNVDGIKVDVHDPEVQVFVDIRTHAYVYTDRSTGRGGLPIGTNGKGMLLLSGGIDSPVAGFMMAKRGVELSAIHFHSYPFTSERAEEKVKSLARQLEAYCGRIKVYKVNILEIQKEIRKNCPEDELTIIVRRFMMRISEYLANKMGINVLITGESLGQVASQTIHGLTVTNSSVQIPIFRPLIGMDKNDIIDISKEIGTFETSILPFEDCCTVFLPKHPVTKPKLSDIEASEENLDVEKLISDAVENVEIMDLGE